MDCKGDLEELAAKEASALVLRRSSTVSNDPFLFTFAG
jgi:hypothetical protein